MTHGSTYRLSHIDVDAAESRNRNVWHSSKSVWQFRSFRTKINVFSYLAYCMYNLLLYELNKAVVE
jgi:hypothetical protein